MWRFVYRVTSLTPTLRTATLKRLTHISAGHCLKKCIASKWKSDVQNPNWNVALWKSVAAPHGKKKMYWLRKKSATFYKIWQLFLDYMENLWSHKTDRPPVFLYRGWAWPHDPWDEMFPLVSQCLVNFKSKLVLRKQPDKWRHNLALYSQSEQTLLSHLLEISVIVKMLSSMTTSQTEKCQQRAKWSPTKPLQCDSENSKLL